MARHSLFFAFLLLFAQGSVSCASSRTQIVEASCGQCQFHMTEKAGCDLAVRIEGKPYFVDGSVIDEHGDAHAEDGFCNAIRRARVHGEIKDGRFKAESFELVE